MIENIQKHFKLNTIFFEILKTMYRFSARTYYNLGVLNVYSLGIDTRLSTMLITLIVMKKQNSFFKKVPLYFNFFKLIKPITLISYRSTNVPQLLGSKKKKPYSSALYEKRPFDRKSLKKRLLSLREFYKKNILFTQSARKLTNNFIKYNRKLPKQWLYYFNFNIVFVLKRLSFCHTTLDAHYLLRIGFVLINKKSGLNKNSLIKLDDLVELFLHPYYLVYNNYITYLLKKNVFRYSYKIRNRARDIYYRDLKQTRVNKHSRRLNLLWLTDYSNQFEVDNLCLSAVLIKSKTRLQSTSIILNSLNSLYIMRLYNWGWYA